MESEGEVKMKSKIEKINEHSAKAIREHCAKLKEMKSKNPKISDKLEKLIASGNLKSYTVINVDENGIPNNRSQFRNTELLKLVFSNGEELIVEMCVGQDENMTFYIS